MVVYLCNIACLTGMWFLLSNYQKDKNRIFCFFASLNWILISGLRSLSVGDDTKAYKEQFTSIKFQTWDSLFEAFKQKYFHNGDGKDIGYGLLEKTFQLMSTNYQLWLFAIAALFFVAFGFFVYKYSENPYLSYILFSTLFYSFFAITGLRQTIATAVVVLIGIELIKRKKFVPFFILIILMSTVHASVLCFLPFYWLSRIKINKVTITVYWLAIIFSFVFNCLVYSGSRMIAGGWYHHNIETGVDRSLPFVPQFLVIYFGCYLFWAVNYILIARQERRSVYQFFTGDFISRCICLGFFLAYPTTNTRPLITDGGLWNQAALWLYSIDAADNLFPSIHCLVSWFCYLGIRGRKEIPVWYQRVSMVIAVLVFASTLLTKQHVIVDVAGGILLAELCFFIGRKTQLYRIYEKLGSRIEKKILKITEG